MLGGMIVYRHRDLFAQGWMVALSGVFAAAMAVLMAATFDGFGASGRAAAAALILLFACPFLMFSQLLADPASCSRTAIARHLGLTSYSIYLRQLPIIQELEKLGWTAGL